MNYTYIAFQFNPDGSSNLATVFNASSLPNTTYYAVMTLHERKLGDMLTKANLKKNYYTIQIDPNSGHVNAYRP